MGLCFKKAQMKRTPSLLLPTPWIGLSALNIPVRHLSQGCTLGCYRDAPLALCLHRTRGPGIISVLSVEG